MGILFWEHQWFLQARPPTTISARFVDAGCSSVRSDARIIHSDTHCLKFIAWFTRGLASEYFKLSNLHHPSSCAWIITILYLYFSLLWAHGFMPTCSFCLGMYLSVVHSVIIYSTSWFYIWSIFLYFSGLSHILHVPLICFLFTGG